MSTLKRALYGGAAAVGLLALLIGAPLALIAWGRVSLLVGIDWAHALTVPDDGRLMLGLLSAVGWLAWLVLVVAVIVELVEVVDRVRAERTHRPHRPVSLPGLDLPRLLVRGLVVSVVTAALGLVMPRTAPPAVAQSVAQYVPRDVEPRQVAVSSAQEPNNEPAPVAPAPDGTRVVVVARGDSLSTLAARYLGDGDRWPEIYARNRDVITNPDLIHVGWRLRIPADPQASLGSAAIPDAAVEADATVPPVVHPGVPDAEQTPAMAEQSPPAESAEPVQAELDESPERSLSASRALALGVVGTIGAGLAAAVVRTIRRRRDIALALRPPGRRILFPPPETLRVESALAIVGGAALAPSPSASATAADGMTDPGPTPAAAEDLARRAALDPPPPVPRNPRHAVVDTAWATVTAGFTADGPVALDLEEHRLVSLDLGDHETTWGTACAWALELACANDVDITGEPAGSATIVAVGPIGDALSAAELDSVVWIPTFRSAIDDLVTTVGRQRAQLEASGWDIRHARLDPDTQAAWSPRVYVFGAVDDESMHRLEWALGGAGPSAVSAIVVHSESSAPARVGARLVGDAEGALLEPDGVTVRPVSLSAVGAAGVVELLRTSGSDDTAPAPWYAVEDEPDNVLSLMPRLAGSVKEVVDVGDDSPGVTDFSHPTLMLLGPIQLLGAAGPPPVRAERSCIEYCAWMVEHPGATASQMAAALLVAESTRRSNVSRLRGWLGEDESGTPYLPEAYTGRLYLDPLVSSDWQRLRSLVSLGVNRVPVTTLVAALRLVRGAPLADAAPGQWHWAEELRSDMVSTIRDIGARVGDAALAEGDVDLARWAVGRALVAAPGDEILMRLRLRTEHRAGNRPEVERIVLQLTRHARVLGIDLDDETVRAIQEAIEGQPRARA